MTLEPVRVLDALSDIDEGMEEYVLRQSKNGNNTLSLVVGEKLFQVLSAKREHGTVLCQHHFSIRRDTITGFNHNRFGWLKSARIALGVTAGIAFVFSSLLAFTPTAPFESGMLVFFLALGGLVFSLCRPHRLSFSTNGDSDSIFFFEVGSVMDLMTVNMAAIDGVMSAFLTTGDFDVTHITYNVGRIGDTIAQDSIVMEEPPLGEPAPPAGFSTEPSVTDEPPVEEATEAHSDEPEDASAIEEREAKESAEQEAEEVDEEIPAPPEVQAEEAEAEEVAEELPAPPVEEAEEVEAAEEVDENIPDTTPVEAPPPPVVNPPPPLNPQPEPPAPPEFIDAQMENPSRLPPPMPTPMPPPSGVPSTPPPPSGLDLPVAIGEVTPVEPPNVPTQAAPRADSISEDEKASILTDLAE